MAKQHRWEFDPDALCVGDLILLEELADNEHRPQQLRRVFEMVARCLRRADGNDLDVAAALEYIYKLPVTEANRLVGEFVEAVRRAGNPPGGKPTS